MSDGYGHLVADIPKGLILTLILVANSNIEPGTSPLKNQNHA